jgi:hypothetical protein
MSILPSSNEAEVLEEDAAHQLAIARWDAGDFGGAVSLLQEVLNGLTLHPRRLPSVHVVG